MKTTMIARLAILREVMMMMKMTMMMVMVMVVKRTMTRRTTIARLTIMNAVVVAVNLFRCSNRERIDRVRVDRAYWYIAGSVA